MWKSSDKYIGKSFTYLGMRFKQLNYSLSPLQSYHYGDAFTYIYNNLSYKNSLKQKDGWNAEEFNKLCLKAGTGSGVYEVNWELRVPTQCELAYFKGNNIFNKT